MDDLAKQLVEIFENGYQVAYLSDPNNADVRFHHLAVPVPKDAQASDLPWRVHFEKPDDGLQDAVWSDALGKWVDNSNKSIPLQINQLTQSFKNISETQKAKDQKDDEALKALQSVQQGQAQTTAVLGQLMPMVEKLSSFANTLQKTETTTSSDNTTNADASKEGDK